MHVCPAPGWGEARTSALVSTDSVHECLTPIQSFVLTPVRGSSRHGRCAGRMVVAPRMAPRLLCMLCHLPLPGKRALGRGSAAAAGRCIAARTRGVRGDLDASDDTIKSDRRQSHALGHYFK